MMGRLTTHSVDEGHAKVSILDEKSGNDLRTALAKP
jgi:hypothetical protein